jgi:hypothetical protein
MSDNSQECGQKPRRNCLFMNSASALSVTCQPFNPSTPPPPHHPRPDNNYCTFHASLCNSHFHIPFPFPIHRRRLLVKGGGAFTVKSANLFLQCSRSYTIFLSYLVEWSTAALSTDICERKEFLMGPAPII